MSKYKFIKLNKNAAIKNKIYILEIITVKFTMLPVKKLGYILIEIAKKVKGTINIKNKMAKTTKNKNQCFLVKKISFSSGACSGNNLLNLLLGIFTLKFLSQKRRH